MHRKRIDQKAVGGFIESILAVMIVTCGIMLLTASLAFVSMQIDTSGDSRKLEDTSETILQRFLSQDQLFLSETVLDFSGLGSSQSRAWDEGLYIDGYRIEIIELTPEISSIFKNGNSIPSIHTSDVISLTVPISVQHSELDVRASLLTVWTW